jgi:hypothetical protein
MMAAYLAPTIEARGDDQQWRVLRREFGYPAGMARRLSVPLGRLPRVKPSTKGEGTERRYFYGSVWAVCWAQPVLWLLWKVVPQTRAGDAIKLVVFLAILAFVGNLARLGRLPRTRPIAFLASCRIRLNSRQA